MEQENNQNEKYWGLIKTISFSALIFIIFLLSQTAAFVLTTLQKIKEQYGEFDASFKHGKLYVNNEPAELASMLDGSILSIVALTSGIICTGLILLIIKLKKGASIREYLHLKTPTLKSLITWTIIIAVFAGIAEILSHYVDALQTDFMAHAYKTADSLLLLYLSIGIIGPVFEEVFFRGFLFKGLERSKIGGIGAVIITSLIFALVHTQYNFAILLVLFPIGLILGFARLKTKSLVVPIILHAMNNIASIAITGFEISN